MKLNEKDYKYFEIDVRAFNRSEMSKNEAKRELKTTLGIFAHGMCELIKKGESKESLLNVLLEVHDEYEAILTELDEREGGD